MLTIPRNLANTRILVTNDDGIHASGLEVLTKIARKFSKDVWIVAPETEQSGAGHSLTLHQPLRVRKLDARRHAVSGTPTDSVLLAAKEIIPEKKPVGLVLSGINKGMNVAEDVTYSGTIAAAMEGTLLDIPSIAVSQALFDPEPHSWKTAEHFVPRVLKQLQGFSWPRGNFLSLNLPGRAVAKVKGVRIASQGIRRIGEKLDARLDPKGRPYYWIGSNDPADGEDKPGTDHTLIKAGYVTLTPLCMNLTNREIMKDLRGRITG